MRSALFVVAGIGWLLVTFFVTLRLTFPSEAIADRLRFEIDRRSGGGLAIDLDDVHRWRFGVKSRGVKILSVDGARTSEFLVIDRARVRVSPFTALSEPHVTGDVRFGDGTIDFALDLVPVEKRYQTRTVSLSSEGFPIGSLPPIADTKLEGTGTFDLVVDLDAPDGLQNASGSARLSGRALAVTGAGSWGELLAGFELLPINIDELDLRIEITEGKARVVRGVLSSSFADAELSGDITLDAALGRSRLRLEALVEFAEVGGTLGSLIGEPWSDGKHHYSVGGTLSRPRPEVEAERSVRRAPRAGAEAVGPAPTPAGTPETLEAARAARERRLDRLRDRRPGAADPGDAVAPIDVPGPIDKDEVVPLDDDLLDDELDDELELEEEAPIEDL